MAGQRGKLVEAYRKKCPESRHTGPDDGYFFSHLAGHLIEAGRADELAELLQDLPWLEANNARRLVFELPVDFDRA